MRISKIGKMTIPHMLFFFFSTAHLFQRLKHGRFLMRPLEKQTVTSSRPIDWSRRNCFLIQALIIIDMGVSSNRLLPVFIHLNRIFHCKPSIVGYTPIHGSPHICGQRLGFHDEKFLWQLLCHRTRESFPMAIHMCKPQALKASAWLRPVVVSVSHEFTTKMAPNDSNYQFQDTKPWQLWTHTKMCARWQLSVAMSSSLRSELG